MGVKLRSGRPRKLSEGTADRIARRGNQNYCLTAKELQEDLAATPAQISPEESSEENPSCVLTAKFSVR